MIETRPTCLQLGGGFFCYLPLHVKISFYGYSDMENGLDLGLG